MPLEKNQPLTLPILSRKQDGTANDTTAPTILFSKDGAAAVALAGSAVSMIQDMPGAWKLALTPDNLDCTTFTLSHSGAGLEFYIQTLTPEAAYTAAKASNLDATISSRGTSNFAGGAVASVTAGVTVATNNDKSGYALTGAASTAIASAVEAQIIDETDSEKVLAAITDKIASANPSLAGLTLSAIASAVKTTMEAAGAMLPAIKAKTDPLPADPASNTQVNTRLPTAGYTAPDNATIAAAAASAAAAKTSADTAKASADAAARPGAEMALTDAARTAAVNALLNAEVEPGMTWKQAIRLKIAVLFGKAVPVPGGIQFLRRDGTTVALTVLFEDTGARSGSAVGSV